MPRLLRFLVLLLLWVAFGITLIVWGVTRTKYIIAGATGGPGSCSALCLPEGYCFKLRPVAGKPRWGFRVYEHGRVSLYELSVQYTLAKPIFGYRFWTSGSGRVYIIWVSYPAALVSLVLLLGAFLPWRRLFIKNVAALPDVTFDDNFHVVERSLETTQQRNSSQLVASNF